MCMSARSALASSRFGSRRSHGREKGRERPSRGDEGLGGTRRSNAEAILMVCGPGFAQSILSTQMAASIGPSHGLGALLAPSARNSFNKRAALTEMLDALPSSNVSLSNCVQDETVRNVTDISFMSGGAYDRILNKRTASVMKQTSSLASRLEGLDAPKEELHRLDGFVLGSADSAASPLYEENGKRHVVLKPLDPEKWALGVHQALGVAFALLVAEVGADSPQAACLGLCPVLVTAANSLCKGLDTIHAKVTAELESGGRSEASALKTFEDIWKSSFGCAFGATADLWAGFGRLTSVLPDTSLMPKFDKLKSVLEKWSMVKGEEEKRKKEKEERAARRAEQEAQALKAEAGESGKGKEKEGKGKENEEKGKEGSLESEAELDEAFAEKQLKFRGLTDGDGGGFNSVPRLDSFKRSRQELRQAKLEQKKTRTKIENTANSQLLHLMSELADAFAPSKTEGGKKAGSKGGKGGKSEKLSKARKDKRAKDISDISSLLEKILDAVGIPGVDLASIRKLDQQSTPTSASTTTTSPGSPATASASTSSVSLSLRLEQGGPGPGAETTSATEAKLAVEGDAKLGAQRVAELYAQLPVEPHERLHYIDGLLRAATPRPAALHDLFRRSGAKALGVFAVALPAALALNAGFTALENVLTDPDLPALARTELSAQVVKALEAMPVAAKNYVAFSSFALPAARLLKTKEIQEYLELQGKESVQGFANVKA